MSNISYVLFGGVSDITVLLLILWGIMNISFIQNKKKLITISISIVALLVCLGVYYNINPDLSILLSTCIEIILICFLFQGNKFRLIAYSLLGYVMAIFLDACIEGIASIFGIMKEGMIMRYLFMSINMLLWGVIVLFKRSRKRSALQLNISKKIYALLFAGAGTGMMIIAGLFVEANTKAGESVRRFVIIITIIIVVCYCAACIMMVFITDSRDTYKALSQINQRVIEAQQQYFTVVNEKRQEIRSIRHEMKNHLTCIHGLYQAHKFKEMDQYINELIVTTSVSADLLDTGNDIVNAILNEAQSRYQRDNIAIRLEGGFPSQLYIVPMDLCVIIANLISNAVEAIQTMEDRDDVIYYVDVRISSFKDDLFITVKNPIDKRIKIVNGVPVTSKKDKNLHGFGVNNVIQKVQKYHGTCEFKVKDNCFYVEINIKNDKQ